MLTLLTPTPFYWGFVLIFKDSSGRFYLIARLPLPL